VAHIIGILGFSYIFKQNPPMVHILATVGYIYIRNIFFLYSRKERVHKVRTCRQAYRYAFSYARVYFCWVTVVRTRELARRDLYSMNVGRARKGNIIGSPILVCVAGALKATPVSTVTPSVIFAA